MESKIQHIIDLLSRKSGAKQLAYKTTLEVFRDMKNVMQELEREVIPKLEDAPGVKVSYFDKGDFEAHFKFSGDTIVAMMHTNIFDFEENHFISKTKYIKEDPLREYCGMIQVYNFLSDSIRYNREQDAGYLIGRIFINKEQHFFIEGKRPLSFLYSDLEKNIMTKEILRNILEEAILFCLNFDLQVPAIETISYITVEQKNALSFSSGIPTSKRLGFQMNKDAD